MAQTATSQGKTETTASKIAAARQAYTAGVEAARTERDRARAKAYKTFVEDKDRKALNAALKETSGAYTTQVAKLAEARDTKIAKIYDTV